MKYLKNLLEKYKLNPTEVLYTTLKEVLPAIREDKYYSVTIWSEAAEMIGSVWLTNGSREVKSKKVSKSDQKTP